MKKNKKIIVSVCVLVLVLIVGFILQKEQVEAPEEITNHEALETATTPVADYKNATYNIDGRDVVLVNGYVESEATPDSSARIVTQHFGNELFTDLDGDGDEDVAFVITQTTGGTGTFFYAVAALNTENGYIGSDGYLLGDRIAPQSTNLSPNPRHKYVVTFNYADRVAGEPMSASPSIGKSAYLKIVPESNRWGVVVADFEGESAL